MKKDLKGLRIRKSIWGRALSITLAGILTVSSCYFAPTRAIADDGEVAVETSAPEEAQQPVEAPAVEEVPADTGSSEDAAAAEAPAEASVETPANGTDAAPAAEGSETPAEGQEGTTEVQHAEGEGTLIDPETGEPIDPEKEPLTEEEEDPEKKDDEEKKEESVFTTTISLIFQMGQETITETRTLTGNDSINLSGQAKSAEGYELSSVKLMVDGSEVDATDIIQRVEGESAALYYVAGGSETAVSGSLSVVYSYTEIETEEKEPEEEEPAPEMITETVIEEEIEDPEVVFTAEYVDADGAAIEGTEAGTLPLTGEEASFELTAENVNQIEGYIYYEATVGESKVTQIRKETKEEIETTSEIVEIGADASETAAEGDTAETAATSETSEAPAAEAAPAEGASEGGEGSSDQAAAPQQKEIIHELHKKTVSYYMVVDGEETEAKENTTITLHYDLDAPSIKLTYKVVDEEDNIIGEYEGLDFPDFDQKIDLAKSPLQEEVTKIERVEGTSRAYEVVYDYVEAQIGGKTIDSISKDTNERTGRVVYTYAAGGSKTKLEDDTVVTLKYEAQEQTRTLYMYNDDHVRVLVHVQSPDAIPDKAELVVTEITQSMEGNAFDAYIDALNKDLEEKPYSAANTLLYDIAFMMPDAEGDGQIEFEPKAEDISVSIKFHESQLSNLVSSAMTEEAEDSNITETVGSSASDPYG